MSEKPAPDETATWQRRLASEANNRAWSLAEAESRTPEEDEDMLQAAHAAMYLWKIVGNANSRAHAAQLVAHAYALLRLPNPARHYLAKSKPYFFGSRVEPWEVALAHAVEANVAAAANDHDAHREHYARASALVAAIPDPEERDILNATMKVVPVPQGGAASAA